MRAGTLRHVATIQAPARTESPVSGEMIVSWADIAEGVRIGISPRDAGESQESNQQVHRVTHVVTLRYRSDLTHDMRFVSGGRAFQITSIINVDEQDRELRVLVSEVTPAVVVEGSG